MPVLINETAFRDSDLKRFVENAFRIAMPTATERKRWRHVRVYVKYGARGRMVGGYAYLGGGPAYIFVRKDQALAGTYGGDWTGGLREELASTIAHELAHTKGLEHKEMRGIARYGYTAKAGPQPEDLFGWAKTTTLRLKEPKKPRPQPTTDDKLAAAEQKVREWTTKKKTATTKVAAWKRKVRSLKAAQTRAAKRGTHGK